VEHDLCNTVMQFSKVKLTHSLFYNHLFYAQLISVHSDKRYVFLSECGCFFIVLCIESMRPIPSCVTIFFANVSNVLVMFRHDFGQGGRALWSPCLREECGR
jgi:hypothetical protein